MIDNLLFEIGAFALLIFLCSYFLTKTCIAFFQKINFVDKPSERKKHKHSTPTGGGIVITLILLSACLFLSGPHTPILLLFIAILILGAVSFLDDIYHLKIIYRLPVQFIASYLAITSLDPIIILKLDFIPPMIMKTILIIGMVYFINLYNFMDGIDGSASSEAIHISISFIAISILYSLENHEATTIAISLCFACLGFVIHNWSPAKIFLGDVGSTVIGLISGWLMLILAKSGFLAAALIIPGYYIADSSITLIKRISSKQRFWEPHTQHYFQIAVKKGYSHAKVTRRIMKYNIVLFVLAIISAYFPLICFLISIALISRLLAKFNR